MNRQLHAPMGFQPEGVVLAQTEMKMAGYTDASAFPMQKRMIEEAAQIPGVTAVGTIDETPMSAGGSSTPVWREGARDFRSSNSVMTAHFFTISPGLLQAAGTHLVAGRDLTWHDDSTTSHVTLVNAMFARTLFGSPSAALGKRFTEPGPTTYEIVGVVEDGKYDSLTEDAQAAMFWPLAQNNENDTTLVVRSNRPPAEITAALQPMLERLDPSLPITLQSWPDALALVLFPGEGGNRGTGHPGACSRACWRQRASLAWRPMRWRGGCARWAFALRWVRSEYRCCVRRWDGRCCCSASGRWRDWCWARWERACWRASCTRRRSMTLLCSSVRLRRWC
jgi:hypothetical protein